jgi:hypothetical protein
MEGSRSSSGAMTIHITAIRTITEATLNHRRRTPRLNAESRRASGLDRAIGYCNRSRQTIPWNLCESGGIGRRTRLRIWRGNPWGFESPLSHQRSQRSFDSLRSLRIPAAGSRRFAPHARRTPQLRIWRGNLWGFESPFRTTSDPSKRSLCGSLNFKRKYAPLFPRVEIIQTNARHIVTGPPGRPARHFKGRFYLLHDGD